MGARFGLRVNAERVSRALRGHGGCIYLSPISPDLQFQWRFSRDEMRNRPRKSRGKLRARSKRQAEESEKNPEDQLPRAGDAEGRVPGQEDWASAEGAAPSQAEGPAEKPRPDGQPCVEGEAVQNGPSGPSPAPAGASAGLPGPEPGEDVGARASAGLAPGPVAAECP